MSAVPSLDKRLRAWRAPAGGLLLLAVFLAPMRHAALRGDDGWNFEKRGLLELIDQSLLSYIADGIARFPESGRPQLLGFQGELVTWVFDGSPLLYRVFLLVLTLLAAWLLYRLVRALGLPGSAGLLVLVLLAGAIQFRSYHDPMLGYYGTTQIMLACTLASLLAFLRFLRTGARREAVLAFLLFLPCPLLYEFSYTLVVLHLGLALVERRGLAAVRASAPFLILGGFFVVVSYVARKTGSEVPEGYEVGSGVQGMIRTYFITLFPPLPGSNLLFDPRSAFLPLGSQPTRAELLAGGWRGLAVFAAVLLICLRFIRAGGAGLPASGKLLVMAVVGALLWVLPTMLLVPAPKYQMELSPGVGYLPVLVQVFGWALVAAAALLGLLRAAVGRSVLAGKTVAVAAAAVIGSAAGVVGYNNLRVVALETPIVETHELITASAEHGLLSELPEGSSIFLNEHDMAWPTGSWQFGRSTPEAAWLRRTDRRFEVLLVGSAFECPPTDVSIPARCAPEGSHSAWMRIRPRRGGGSVILQSLQSVEPARALTATTRELRVFAADDGGGTPPPPRLVASTLAGQWSSDGLRWERSDAGDGWAIYEARVESGPAPVANTMDDAAAEVDYANRGTPDQMVRIYGTKRLLP